MSEHNPWKTLKSEPIYHNAWIDVREDKVIRPDGKEGIYGVVTCRPAIGILALTEKNELYLVGQYRYPMGSYSWEIIEGGAEEGEDILTSAKRELKEEAGLLAENWEPFGHEIHLSNCHSSERGYLFVARDLTTVEAEPDGTEVLQVKKLPFSEVLQLVYDGQIQDSLTIIGVLRMAQQMERGQ